MAAIHKNTIISPTGNSQVAAAKCCVDPAIVVVTNRIYGLLEIGWVGSPKGEQINNFHGAESPEIGERDTSSDGWVISLLIGG